LHITYSEDRRLRAAINFFHWAIPKKYIKAEVLNKKKKKKGERFA
jgi:hypothetical protein